MEKEEEEERKEIEVGVGELGIVFPCPYCGEWDYIKIDELKNKEKVLFKCSCGKEFKIKLTWSEKEA
ncbi:MAG TPA: hypothetical protein PK119_00515 [Candidatus Paceibacterota bacterium]|nr:hypothetical protein [Candidatus Paceibacterota bacterium]